jgi:hypothetical protein
MRQKRYPMDRGNELTERECSGLVSAARRSALCGRSACVLQRRVVAPGVHLERVVVPMRCGLRRCSECRKQKKAVAIRRMDGRWRQFVTFTIPHDECSRYHAWRHASRWMTELMERLRKEGRYETRQCVADGCRGRDSHPSVCHDGGKFDYAWVIEPHKDEFPHWHIAWTASYVCYDYLREIWQEITGLSCGNIKTIAASRPEHTTNYLSKYMSKGVYPDDVLAIMHRKRLWASTIKSPVVWSKGYKVVDFMTAERARIDERCPVFVRSEFDTGVTGMLEYWQLEKFVPGVVTKFVFNCGSEATALAALSEDQSLTESLEEYSAAERSIALRRAMRVVNWKVDEVNGRIMVDEPGVYSKTMRKNDEIADNAQGEPMPFLIVDEDIPF